ncbi:MAG: class I SAM-dependent methyltransferase [Desulfobacteraceae bacterium]|jgi:tRNA (cmo5U34)-methyltransferase
MTKFEESLWTDKQYGMSYRDDANIYLPFRNQFFKTAKSIFKMFVSIKPEISVLDLGCGDGLFVKELINSFDISKVVMVDGSSDMLEAAMRQIENHSCINFVHANFQQLLRDDPFDDYFDFIFSSLAIHHINLEEKVGIYKYCYDHLNLKGWFLNYDVVLPATGELEIFYLSLWQQWIAAHPDKKRSKKLFGIPDQYKANSDNIPDKLDTQLAKLKKIGFRNVDCLFRFGIFSLFGGCK